MGLRSEGNALALQGIPVSTTAPTANQVLTYDNATGLWKPAAGGGAGAVPTGTGLYHVTGGAMDAASYKGTANQVLTTNAGATDTAWTSMAGDVTGTVGASTVVSIAGSGGTCTLNVANLTYATAQTSPTIKQADQGAASTAGQQMLIQAQTATGSGGASTGGSLVLYGGGSSSSTKGGVLIGDASNGPYLLATLGSLAWANGVSGPKFSQLDNTTNSATAQSLTVQAANATGTTANGGALVLTSGTGTTSPGDVVIQRGGTESFRAGVNGLTLAAGVSIGGNAGAGSIACAAMTGPTSLPTGSLSWNGAAAKTLSLVGAAAMTISAGAALSISGLASSVVSLGVNPATTGQVNLSNNGGGFCIRNAANSGDNLTLTCSGANTVQLASQSGVLLLFGSTGVLLDGSATKIETTGGTTYYTITPGVAFTLTASTSASTSVTYNQADNTTNSATAAPTVHQAQNATGTTATGGSNTLAGGTGTSFGGAARMATNGTVILVEACNVTGSLNVVALARKSALTTTQMPANTGDGVVYVSNAATNPTANAVGGGILYANAGAGTWRGTGGTTTAFGPAGPHCGECGYDAWTVACYNDVWKSWHYECGHCGAVYKGGPKKVHDLLTEEQRAERLSHGMKFEDIKRVMHAA